VQISIKRFLTFTYLLRLVVRQTGEETLFERVASKALVEVLDLGDNHLADGRQIRGRLRVDHVLRLTLAVHVQLKQVTSSVQFGTHMAQSVTMGT